MRARAARGRVIDDRARIVDVERHARRLQHRDRRLPGFVYPFGRKPRELGQEPAHVRPIGVEAPALGCRIEDPEVRCGVRAAPGDPLPAERIRGEVGIDQGVPEPRGAVGPRQQQILDQERTRDHAHPVVHPARAPQLPHARIDDRVAGAPAVPRGERRRIVPPREARERGAQRLDRGLRKMVQQVVREFAPPDLGEELRLAPAQPARCRERAYRMPDLARADLAEMQMRRQA